MVDNNLISLPNIGEVLSERLKEVGIRTTNELKNSGSENAFIRLLTVDASSCINELLALEGAIQGIRWHNLDNEKKEELKIFYRMCKAQQKKETAMKNKSLTPNIGVDTIADAWPNVSNYDNFFLPVDDYEESKRFYAEILGLKKKFEFEAQGMVAFCIGNEEPAIILKDKKKFPDATPTIWIEVPNVKALYDEMKNKGVKFSTEPFKIRTGWAVEFTDPSGNNLGFTDYIS